jgi:transposase
MKRFVEGEDRTQGVLLPEFLDDYVAEDNPVRVVDVFIDELDLEALGFSGVVPEQTGRPAYHPATLLKIYLYGYLNRIQSSRRLERESQRNLGLQDDRRLPPRQRAGDPRGLCAVRRAVPSVQPFHAGGHCDRREQVQGSQQSRQELHSGKGRQAH